MQDIINFIPVIAIVLVVLIIAVTIIKRWQVSDPDTAIVITGRGSKIIKQDKGTFVLPFIQKSTLLRLGAKQVSVTSEAQSKQGTPLTVTAVAQYKINSNNDESIRAAAERFASNQDEIAVFVRETLQGALRTIVGEMDPEQLITDRAGFTQKVKEIVDSQLSTQGLWLDNFNIQNIEDSQGYLRDFSRPIAAEVRRAAEIADIEASRASELKQIEADLEVQEKNRELLIRKAEIKAETDKAEATANAAAPLEAATREQEIIEQQRITAIKEAELKEQKLDAEVKKVADAEAYRVTKIAEAKASETIALAEAEKASRVAKSEAEKAEGLVDAEIISKRGSAEAEATRLKAAALAEQSEALILQDLIQTLPRIAHELASPMNNIDNLTVVSTDGANELSKNVVGGFNQIENMLKPLGVDLNSLMSRIGSNPQD